METKQIYLGNRLDSSGEPNGKREYWRFDGEGRERSPHAVLIGGSGCGKTEAIKAMCFEMKEQNVSSLIFDFHNDFDKLSTNLISLENKNASINPLSIREEEKPIDVSYKISNIFSNIFELSDIQQGILRNAIKRYYFLSGIKNLKEASIGKEKLLPFKILRDILRNPSGIFSLFDNIDDEEKYNIEKESPLNATDSTFRSILTRLEIVFDTDLFMRSSKNSIPFKTMLSGTSVIQLHEYPTDNIKRIIAEILIRNLINHFYFEGKSEDSKVKLFCIIDEGHRMVYEGSPIDLLLRESRKYGIGCILASQGINDFSDNVFRNVGITFSFSSSHDKDISTAARSMSRPKSDYKKLDEPGKCFVKYASSPHDSVAIRIETGEDRPRYKKYVDSHNKKEKEKNSETELKRKAQKQKEKEEYERLKQKFPELQGELQDISQSLRDQEEKNNKLSTEAMKREERIDSLEKLKNNLNNEKLQLLKENEIIPELKSYKISLETSLNLEKNNVVVLTREISNLKIKYNDLELGTREEKKKYSKLLGNYNLLNKENKSNSVSLELSQEEVICLQKKQSKLKILVEDKKKELDISLEKYNSLNIKIKNKLKEIEYVISKGNRFARGILNKLDLKIDKRLKLFCEVCGAAYSKEDSYCDTCGGEVSD